MFPVARRQPEAGLEDEKAEYGDSAIPITGTLEYQTGISTSFEDREVIKSNEGNLHTAGSANPKAEPKTVPSNASQPMARRARYGSLKNGSWTQGIQTDSTGLVTAALGMNRNAMTLRVG